MTMMTTTYCTVAGDIISPPAFQPDAATAIPLAQFGRDHWSVLAYLETVAVDNMGKIDRRKMRCHAGRHPFLANYGLMGNLMDGSKYPTRLAGGVEQYDHDDWDCADDLVVAGLLLDVGFTVEPAYELTELGFEIAGQLRAHLAQERRYATFVPELPG